MPVRVSSPAGFVDVTAGDLHACALNVDNRLWCWGDPRFSGTMAPASHSDPRMVTTSQYIDVSPGPKHTCAVRDDGHIVCWGENDYGQLGDESTVRAGTPVNVQSDGVPAGFAQVAVGTDHTCALATDGALYCWGEGIESRIEGTMGRVIAPLRQASGFVFDHVTAGRAIACAIEAEPSRTMYCIGYGRGSITMADGTRYSPVAVASSHAWSTADLGDAHICAIDDAGMLWCWGTSDIGAHGRMADAVTSPTPIALPGLVHDVCAGRAHSCAIVGDARDVYCWGANGAGQLGLGVVGGGVRMPTAPVVFAP